MRLFTVIFFTIISPYLFAQSQQTTVSGFVLDENENPIEAVSIIILGKTTGIQTDSSGYFRMNVVWGKAFALQFSHTGFLPVQKNFLLNAGEQETVVIQLKSSGETLETVVITDESDRTEPGLVRINPKNSIQLPSTTGGVEGLLKILVGSNNELSSQYSVRGGNYDENLIYINDFEVYRPYLVSSGQQEGLSMINPELARNVSFYTGGFQSKYGDKMSSVLDIQYKNPTQFGGSVYAGLLEQGLHLEGRNKNQKLSYLLGARNKNNRNVLSNQPTLGAYIPSANDVQLFLQYNLNPKIKLQLLGILSASKFTFFPESVQKTASVYSPLFSANLGLDIYFEGQEKDHYRTSLAGFAVQQKLNDNLNFKWMLSYFADKESENYDIGGAYLFGDRDFDNNSGSFGQITNPLGAGYYQQYARNELDIEILNLGHKGDYKTGIHFLQWGVNVEKLKIADKLLQWELQDSAGYSIPFDPQNAVLQNAVNSSTQLDIYKYSGYLQNNMLLPFKGGQWIVQTGVRLNYNSLNQELLISPRLQTSLKPNWEKDMIFKAAVGMYSQPPFYRELRNFNGEINQNIQAQKSLQAVMGMDYNFKGFGGRPFRFTAEAYYKKMWDVIPYDLENVKIRYHGHNEARAYSTGLELRLFGELVEDAESWVSLAFMRSRENLDHDFYYNYLNAAGEVIQAQSEDQVVVDSSRVSVGWLRRPSDRLITAGLYLEDYLSTNKNFKVHLNLIYGTNMSYNIAHSVRYRNALTLEPYMRADVGFSVLLLNAKSTRRSHSPFKDLENIWLSFEVFNLINRYNTISYQMIKDFSNTQYAIPNRLTPRMVNVKILARF